MPSPADKPEIQPTPPKPRMRLIPLDDTVVFPNMGITLTIDVGDDKRVILVPRHDGEYLEVGTIVEVSEQVRLPGGGRAVALSGEHRALIGAEVNVVLKHRLWPRSLFADPILDADRRALTISAEVEERLEFENVDVDFDGPR